MHTQTLLIGWPINDHGQLNTLLFTFGKYLLEITY